MRSIKNILLAGIFTLCISTSCGLGGPTQFVDPNTADVRGTWYMHGASKNGWFGPDNEYWFGWYYLEQYGSEIRGRYEHELYYKGKEIKELTEVIGTMKGNEITFNRIYPDNPNATRHDYHGTFIEPDSIDMRNSSAEGYQNMKRVSNRFERRLTPWN